MMPLYTNLYTGYVLIFHLICLLTAYCLDDSTDLLRGHYSWTEREATVMQTLPCEYKGTVTEGGCDITEANATRQCNEYGRWEKPNVSRCISEVTRTLCDVRNVRLSTLIHDHILMKHYRLCQVLYACNVFFPDSNPFRWECQMQTVLLKLYKWPWLMQLTLRIERAQIWKQLTASSILWLKMTQLVLIEKPLTQPPGSFPSFRAGERIL